MNVAFDGICLGDGPVTGVARAFLTGLTAYTRIAATRPVLLLPAGATAPELPVDVVPAPRGRLRRQWLLPRLLRRLGATLLHSPVAAVPLHAPCPTIATVHDLPWLSPGSGERSTPWRRFATRRSLRAAAAVIAPSTFTLAAAARLVARDRLRLIPHATPLPLATTEPRHGPFLVLGDDRPRKNQDRLRAAWQRAHATDPGLPPLQFCGPPAAYVSEADKATLLRRCTAVVQVSVFEGFGLPVLEALAAGAPIVCADIPPFREIAAEHALFVDPLDLDAIAAALLRIHREPALRARLHENGPPRAAAFAPERLARAWLALHEELAR